MMMIIEMMRRIQRLLLAISQGRGDTIDYLQSRHIGIQHTTFFFLLLFLIPFSKHLGLVLDKGLYLRTSSYIYAFNLGQALNSQDIWLIVCFYTTLLLGCLKSCAWNML